jgi:hypothetical protein
MLKTATKQATTPAPPPADPYGQPPQYAQEPPQPVIYDPQDQGQPTAKAPVVVNVRQDVTQHVDQPQQQYAQPYYGGYPLGYSQYGGFIGAPVVNRPVAAPVYWGWGGQRRPDSWQPTPEPRLPNQVVSPMNQAVSPMNQPSTTRATTNGRGGGG